MQNLATSAALCGFYYTEGTKSYDVCLHGFLNLGLVSGAAGATIGAATTVAGVTIDAAETVATTVTPLNNLGLISEVTNDIADIYACATTEEQAYCVSKAKSYGIFTGVNGS